jgi:hypothetical protein
MKDFAWCEPHTSRCTWHQQPLDIVAGWHYFRHYEIWQGFTRYSYVLRDITRLSEAYLCNPLCSSWWEKTATKSASSREALCIYTITYMPRENNTPAVADQRSTKNLLKSAVWLNGRIQQPTRLQRSTKYDWWSTNTSMTTEHMKSEHRLIEDQVAIELPYCPSATRKWNFKHDSHLGHWRESDVFPLVHFIQTILPFKRGSYLCAHRTDLLLFVLNNIHCIFIQLQSYFR